MICLMQHLNFALSKKKDVFFALTNFKDICYLILPILKYFQNFAYSLFYAWAIHL